MFNFFVTKMYLALNFALKVIKKLVLIKILGTIFLAIAVLFLGLFIILRRSMLKPFDSKQRLPGNDEQTGGTQV